MKTLDAHAPDRAPSAPRRRRRTARSVIATSVAVAGLAGATFVVGTSAVGAASNPYERGPAPTKTSLEASRGSFATATTNVGSASGFGGGTIYYPTTTDVGKFGGVVIAPGYTETSSNMAWYGPRLASQGFVVFTIDTYTTLDQPASRGRQMEAALDYLTTRSSVASRVDASRTAVMGHSMGGGGSLEAALDRPSLKAIIPLTPWDLNKNFSANVVPTLIVGAQNDLIAPAGQHAVPFYNSLSASDKKVYVELRGASHLAPVSSNTTIAKFSIAWLKRWVDNDTRYSPFLCNISTDTAISVFRSNCPF
jgi:dienelactone hydrolase